MNLLYNTQNQITSSIENFLKNNVSCLYKPQEKIIPSIIFGMIIGETIIKAIDNAYSLFKDKGFEIVFLADRWFNSQRVLKHIDDIGCTYCVRLKGNLKIKWFLLRRRMYFNINIFH